MIKLSIIVPVYNMAADGKLEYCINSLLNQTLKEIEIIAVDDASTDNSAEILKQFEKDNPEKFRVILSPENHKQGAAKNLGIKASKGEYLGFMDADDWALDVMYERLYDLAVATGADMVGCDLCHVSEHTMEVTERIPCNKAEQTGILDHEKYEKLFLDPGPLVTKIYKREIFFEPEFEFPSDMFFEDNATGVELYRRVKHFEYIPESMYFYLQHAGSTVHVITKERCEHRLEAMRIMVSYAKKYNYLEEFHTVLEYKFMNLFYQNTLFSYMQDDRKKDLSFIQKMGREMKETFPDFMENPYFIKNVPEEEKKLMKLQLKSTFFFVLYYNLKKYYRRIRYGRKA